MFYVLFSLLPLLSNRERERERPFLSPPSAANPPTALCVVGVGGGGICKDFFFCENQKKGTFFELGGPRTNEV